MKTVAVWAIAFVLAGPAAARVKTAWEQQQQQPERDLEVREYAPPDPFAGQPPQPGAQRDLQGVGTAFINQYNSLMQNRVNQLTDRFPWTFRPDDCDLSMEVFPLYYVPILRSSNVRIVFSSNCLTSRDVTFEVSYDDELFINWIYHPTTVYLNLWNNVYRLEFARPAVIDRFDVMKSLEYTSVTVFNANASPVTLDLTARNVLYLRPQQLYSFNRANLRKLRNIRGYFPCLKTSRRLSNWELHAPKRDELVARMRAQGETEEAILAAVDRLIPTLFSVENSLAAIPASVPTPEQLATASPEAKEEAERLRAREIAKRAFLREFIEEFEVDCQVL